MNPDILYTNKGEGPLKNKFSCFSSLLLRKKEDSLMIIVMRKTALTLDLFKNSRNFDEVASYLKKKCINKNK